MIGKQSLSPKPDDVPGRGSIWQHSKGAFYRVVGYSRHSENPDQWLVTYRPLTGESDDWTRAILFTERNAWPGFLDSFTIPAFKGDPGWHRFAFVSGPRSWKDEQPTIEESPAYAELLELLDNVSAAAENMLVRFGGQMYRDDCTQRRKVVGEARALCDALLRQEAA